MQRLQIIKEHAMFYLKRSQFETAAQCFVKSEIRFDEAALNLLLFNNNGDGYYNTKSIQLDHTGYHALYIYLKELLKSLPMSAKSQKTMVVSLFNIILIFNSFFE